jgi:hypothetical protein
VVLLLGVFDVIAEVPIGLLVLHVALTVQLLAPDAIVHEVGDSVNEPVGCTGAQLLPFQLVPEAQPAVAVLLASSWPLL